MNDDSLVSVLEVSLWNPLGQLDVLVLLQLHCDTILVSLSACSHTISVFTLTLLLEQIKDYSAPYSNCAFYNQVRLGADTCQISYWTSNGLWFRKAFKSLLTSLLLGFQVGLLRNSVFSNFQLTFFSPAQVLFIHPAAICFCFLKKSLPLTSSLAPVDYKPHVEDRITGNELHSLELMPCSFCSGKEDYYN